MILKLFYKNKIIKFAKVKRSNVGDSILELFLYLNSKNNSKNHFFFFDGRNVCNNFLNYIIKKKLNFFFLAEHCCFLSKKIKFFNNYFFEMPRWWNKSDHNLNVNKLVTPKIFTFSKKQIISGNKFLKKNGFRNQKIICLLVRDDLFKKKYGDKSKDWSYHDYRNADIRNYRLAVDYLLKKNYFVIKIGKSSKQKLDLKHPNFFDYSFLEKREDFLDFFIISRCFFCITTGSGIDEACAVYKKPILDTNFFPIGVIRSGQNYCISIFKKILNIKKNTILNLSELIKMQKRGTGIFSNFNFFQSAKFHKKFKLIDNSAEEILDATIEIDKRLNKNFFENLDDLKVQNKFWSIYKKSGLFEDFVGQIHKNSRISKTFINKNRWVVN